MKGGVVPPTMAAIEDALSEITAALRESTQIAFAHELFAQREATDLTKAWRMAGEKIQKNWGELTQRLSIVSGKDCIAGLSKWSQDKFGVSFSSARLARELTALEINSEVAQVLEAVEHGTSLPWIVCRCKRDLLSLVANQ